MLTTEIWGLLFFLENGKLCFIDRSPSGEEKRYWSDKLPPRLLNMLTTKIDKYEAQKEADRKLTPQERAEKWFEYGGS